MPAAGRRTRERGAMLVPVAPLELRRRSERLLGREVGAIGGEKRFTCRQFGERWRRPAAALHGLRIRPGEVVSFPRTDPVVSGTARRSCRRGSAQDLPEIHPPATLPG